MVRPRVFFDFAVKNEPVGRVIFELFNDTAPRTSENFRALCTGEKGVSAAGNPLYYKNSIIHRSIKDFMVQGGDFTKRNGSGGESIYGGTFADEDLTRDLDMEGLLCMANKGPDTNGSQFFITLRECPHLNGKHIVFGKVIRGYEEVVKGLAQVEVDAKDRPVIPILITNCGELELRKPREDKTKPPPESRSADVDGETTPPTTRAKRSSSPGSETKHRRSKKSKRKKHEAEPEPLEENGKPNREETEEEYDARLEREELERIEADRKRELERIKRKYESEIQSVDGVRFKGRGRMKFIDPEIEKRPKHS